ncbi:hypothetical protein Pst134EA_019422 [Puccinia striiformis f. sp. tritici]|uniref:Uncharacterized protein n=3 Tax=Puccinia striiformis TaxID=27350 RepID=A0A0L0VEZ5_9BASI|nr:hypothetical protein Pst134EA_019422 [Puccinia striiformis f. sp. tritici]KAI9627455.1 hypothetical protein H4Q26_017358 [Puccinia striiformis f. sp. tritici PST-130]KNE97549.1 hypothetical protein PSTG_09244 [Puccinia striiformis f. sp. tritici PST-78]POW01779.1 hypothetical protein PSTT_12238 [Puccinia striiformis]KAH9449483.1 hypothetical protein Pst134EB_020311 [Puccinia striiformis f. sp. tritici]KAH9459267.1 hypothetical protein Pst134EA_019422 [Puccinia striiformis f. sp. tritici]
MEITNASLDDNDLTNEEFEDHNPLQSLWPMFQKDTNSKQDLPFFQQKLKSNKHVYLEPRENNDPDSCKLIPSKIPQQRKYDRFKMLVQADGHQGQILMKNYESHGCIP